MTIFFDLPLDIERELLAMGGADFGREAKEAYLVELYRRERITHDQLAQGLGLSRLETDSLLKRYQVPSGPATVAEHEGQVTLLRDLRPR